MPNRAASRGRGYTDAETERHIDIIEKILPEGPNDWMHVQEQHMLYYPGEVRMCDSLKRKFQALYNSKRTPIVRRAKRACDRMKKQMDFSDGEGILNDAVIAGMGNGDDDVDEEEEGAGGGTNNIEEFTTEVASGVWTVLHATTSRSETMGGENSVSSVGGTTGGTPSIPVIPPLRTYQL